MIIIGVLLFKFFYKPKGFKFKEFEIPELKDITKEGLKRKFDLFGIVSKKNGKIYRSIQEIAQIKRYFEAEGSFDIIYYDVQNKEILSASLNAVVKNNKEPNKSEEKIEEIKYNLFFVEAHNKFFLFKWFGINPSYFILKSYDDENRPTLQFNPQTESLILNARADLTSYADVWSNCDTGIQYINDISMIRLNERLQALLDSAPDKYTHLEMETAKLKTRVQMMSEAERRKYKDKEEAGDTTIL